MVQILPFKVLNPFPPLAAFEIFVQMTSFGDIAPFSIITPVCASGVRQEYQ
jgi:hypothetical protein